MLWELWQIYDLEIIIGTAFLGPWICMLVAHYWKRYQLEWLFLAALCTPLPITLLAGYSLIYTPYMLTELEKGGVKTIATVVHRCISTSNNPGLLVYRYEVPLANGQQGVYFGDAVAPRYVGSTEMTIIYAASDPSVSRGASRADLERLAKQNTGAGRLWSGVIVIIGGGATILLTLGYIEKKQKQLRYRRDLARRLGLR